MDFMQPYSVESSSLQFWTHLSRSGRQVLVLAALCIGPSASAATQETTAARRPKNLILMIADGFGPTGRTMARQFTGERLTLDGLLVGSASTRSSNSLVTDSAAGATVYASGVQTYNGAIGVNAVGAPVATLLEAAEERGMLTGLISTARMTHATPACFAAHVPNRIMEARIAEQELVHGIELMLGGGQQYFLPVSDGGKRIDGRNLFVEATDLGYQVLKNRAGFDALERLPVIGLFTDSHMAYELDRDPEQEPSIAEMTAKAIELLSAGSEKGFFLMVEGGRIDHAGHANDPAGHVHDILAYDAAVAEALKFAEADRETLLISVADHETGGLALGRNENNTGIYTWKPDYVRSITASVEAMTAGVTNAVGLKAAIKKHAGIESLTSAEEGMLVELEHLSGKDLSMRIAQLASIYISQRALTGWSSWGHTAVDIEVFVHGPGSDVFRGHHTNFEIGRMLAERMSFDLAATKPILEDKQ
ncbi:MAG: alkaline phosphatase [Planctomycetota bacterium]|jgi:alkaline phosphatase